METNLKRTAALELLAKTGIWRNNYEPPLIRLIWCFGFDVPPPHFASFLGSALIAGMLFGAGYGLLTWFILWSNVGMSFTAIVLSAATAGVFFGLCMASYYRYGRKRHNLPTWEQLNV